ncbi:alpha-amylase [Nakamurella antarctica]|uniref:Alpha-amylase n=1 Tax=Nakamurella antarctica TaxID=1902245 RepID=A0A3G8ZLU4_9ACTN|nr:glycoside hydrolase family 13 protein [Nakamurella antarctica]AZI58309.1 alpha-amylase [Nakamurella antarctica]
MTSPANSSAASSSTSAWWSGTVGYQVYIRSFADSNGDGVGDLRGIREHLGYLELIGVKTIWITPFYPSPMNDAGYDVSDPRDIDPSFGTLADLDELVAEIHDRGMKLLIDVVPNHSSSEHPWFVEALAAEPGSAARDRYIFREGKGPEGAEPPNNWKSIFGGSVWQRVPDGQWYLHIFDASQPDFNWDNPDVREDLGTTLRFWFDRGIDGLRIDVAHGMAKPEGLPDVPADSPVAHAVHHDGGGVIPVAEGASDPRFDNDGVHDIHRYIRSVVDEYTQRASIGEVWVADPARFADYLRPDELHQAFSFGLTEVAFDAEQIVAAITRELATVASVGKVPAWTLSNHDLTRPATRYGDGELGRMRARAMLLVEMALPGAFYLYNGEELGLPNIEIPDGALQDPTWERSGHTERGRDGARLPLPWDGEKPPFGFSTNAHPWLPSPVEYAPLTVEKQLEDPHSTLNLVRLAIEIRESNPALSGDHIDWYGAPAGCFAFRRSGGLVCALNSSDVAIDLPPGDVVVSSIPLVDGQLPPNAAVWLV